jgi:lysophospholipid acyltransferase (LPLAT)-like uncharacterized protein
VIGREKLQGYSGKEGFIINTWHGQQLAGFYFFRGCGYYILSSLHRDGEISSSVMRKLGWRIIRGSSTKGGARGVIELMRVLRQGAGTVLTPDGPQGPIYHIEPGGIYLARKTGAALIPLAFVFDHKWIVEKSWDKFVIPKPFTRCVAYFGAPIMVTAELTDENLAIEKQRLQDAIHEANRHGEEVLQQWRSGK